MGSGRGREGRRWNRRRPAGAPLRGDGHATQSSREATPGQAGRLGEGDAVVLVDELGEVFPAGEGLLVEDVQVEGDELGIVFAEEGIDGGLEFGVVEGFGEVLLHGAFAVVGDAHAVAEVDEEGLLAFHEPDLEEVFADDVLVAELEGLVEPGDLVGDGFFLDEDGAQLAVLGEAGDGGLVEIPFLLAEVEKHFLHEGRVEFLVELVDVHCAETGEGRLKRQEILEGRARNPEPGTRRGRRQN